MGVLRFPVSPLLSRSRAGSLSQPRCVRAGDGAAELLGEVLSVVRGARQLTCKAGRATEHLAQHYRVFCPF